MLAKTLSGLARQVAAAVAAVAILVPLAVTSPLADEPQYAACDNTPYCGG